MIKPDPEPSCPNIGKCALFPLISKPGFLRVWQINYCEGDFARCERFRRNCAGESLPATLLPNGQHLVVKK
ncbi:MAG: hypothetical protein Q8O67_16120 [Deltaproteobacteria bacterium]|nr:hypothetical protein [Deltaproteobacteria bacterium]